jgi:proteasome lid subunit RPN8/RPN11
MISINDAVRAEIHRHAKESMPREACGLLVDVGLGVEYQPCENLATGQDQFVMKPEDWQRAEDRGEILAVVHSHPNMPPIPSQADRAGCAVSKLPWLIVSYPLLQEAWMSPEEDYRAEYLERQFAYGVLDCYTLFQDYYRRELGIETPPRSNYADEPLWWVKGKDLYNLAEWEKFGFVVVEAPQEHDVSLILLGRSSVPNHVAIHLRAGAILHHVQGHLSTKEVYGGYWQKHTRWTLRHRSLA